MNSNLNFLINFFQQHTDSNSFDLGEQESTAGTSDAGSTSSGKSPKKWETGLTRGKANQIAVTKWESGRTFGKTYMNDPKYVWKSDRAMGKTGGSDFA
jgi:hypothetical protein